MLRVTFNTLSKMSTNNIINEHNDAIFIVESFIFTEKTSKKGHLFIVLFTVYIL